jgi:hyperosmotically inducible protein
MKSKTTFIGGASLASLLALTSLSAQTPTRVATPASAPGPASDRSGHSSASATTAKGSDLVGMKVEDKGQQRIGKVEDLAVDLQAGRVVHVILSTGGFLSMGDRQVAVPPGGFVFDAGRKSLQLDVTPDRLKSAPAFEAAQWTDYYKSDRRQESDRYFSSDAASVSMSSRRAGTAGDGPGNRMGHVQKATKVMGLPVASLQDEKIGSVEDLVIDLPSGRVVAVIVSSGGFLGLGDALSVVPPAALRQNEAHDGLRLDTTKEALTQAPRLQKGEWPDFAQAGYADSMQRAYRMESSAGLTAPVRADADNAVRNADNRTLTAADQSNSTGDVKITQEIRQGVMAAAGLSTNARNVKIITAQGRVTLRGPVASLEEKNLVGEIANGAAGGANVDNQIEITKK